MFYFCNKSKKQSESDPRRGSIKWLYTHSKDRGN